MGYILQNYGIYWAKTIGYLVGYILQNYGINYRKNWLKFVLIYFAKLWDILVNKRIYKGRTERYIWPKNWAKTIA